MKVNPIIPEVSKILRSSELPISEYDLMVALDFNQGDLGGDAKEGSELELFRKHFLIMNALYTLQEIYWEEGELLTVSALKIEILPVAVDPISTSETLPLQPGDLEVRSYYLDWDEFEQSCDESVAALLDDFWQKYYAQDKAAEAMASLDLNPGCSAKEIKRAYRLLASEHHPDKGGDPERFIQIREAYELLISYNYHDTP